MASKTLVQFIRQQLGFSGKTFEDTLGVYTCQLKTTWPEFTAKLDSKITAWSEAGLIKQVDRSIEKIHVVFKVHSQNGTHASVTFTKFQIESCRFYNVGAGWTLDI